MHYGPWFFMYPIIGFGKMHPVLGRAPHKSNAYHLQVHNDRMRRQPIAAWCLADACAAPARSAKTELRTHPASSIFGPGNLRLGLRGRSYLDYYNCAPSSPIARCAPTVHLAGFRPPGLSGNFARYCRCPRVAHRLVSFARPTSPHLTPATRRVSAST